MDEHRKDCHPDVSVIMPVYNSENFLANAIESILSEHVTNFELILVDDGSSDGSGAVCDSYAASDSRVRVIHKSNGGMCQARNWGLLAAKGEYVTFCDNDDTVLSGFLFDNLALAREYNADCVRFGVKHVRLSANGALEKAKVFRPREFSFFDGGMAAMGFVSAYYGIEGVWSGIYRLSLIREHQLEFPESFRHGFEDILFNLMFMLYSNRYLYNPNVYYQWVQRVSHSASTELSYNGLKSASMVMRFEHEVFELLGLLEQHKAFFASRNANFIQSFLTMSYHNSTRNYASERQLYVRCREVLKDYADLYDCHSLSPTTEAAVLLLQKRYRILYTYIGLGAQVKNLCYAIDAISE